MFSTQPNFPTPPVGNPPVKVKPGDQGGSSVDFSFMNNQLEEAKRARRRAEDSLKALRREHEDAKKQLEEVDKRINAAVLAQQKANKNDEGPLRAYSKLQRKTLQRIGLGTISNKQSFGLAAVTILLGLTAIIGRVE